jgi:hypothetical protein
MYRKNVIGGLDRNYAIHWNEKACTNVRSECARVRSAAERSGSDSLRPSPASPFVCRSEYPCNFPFPSQWTPLVAGLMLPQDVWMLVLQFLEQPWATLRTCSLTRHCCIDFFRQCQRLQKAASLKLECGDGLCSGWMVSHLPALIQLIPSVTRKRRAIASLLESDDEAVVGSIPRRFLPRHWPQLIHNRAHAAVLHAKRRAHPAAILRGIADAVVRRNVPLRDAFAALLPPRYQRLLRAARENSGSPPHMCRETKDALLYCGVVLDDINVLRYVMNHDSALTVQRQVIDHRSTACCTYLTTTGHLTPEDLTSGDVLRIVPWCSTETFEVLRPAMARISTPLLLSVVALNPILSLFAETVRLVTATEEQVMNGLVLSVYQGVEVDSLCHLMHSLQGQTNKCLVAAHVAHVHGPVALDAIENLVALFCV